MNLEFFKRLRKHKHSSAYRAVGLVLAIRAKPDDPVCWPSITSLCKDASVCRLTVVRAINHFEAEGLLTIEKRDGKVHRYHLNPATTETGQAPRTSKPQRRHPPLHRDGSSDSDPATTETGTSKPQRRHPATTETRIDTLRLPKQKEPDADVPDSEVPY
jgi:DNA-binding transcriptional MocR family regulator